MLTGIYWKNSARETLADIKTTSAETVTEEILSSGIGKKYLDTIIKRLAGLYTDREDIVNRFALLSGIVGDSEELLFR